MEIHPIKYVVDRFALKGWPDFAEAMVPDPPPGVPPKHFHQSSKAEAELEAEISARDASALCEQEEADRLRRQIARIPVKFMTELQSLPGNRWLDAETFQGPQD